MDAAKLLRLKQTAEDLSKRKEQATGRMQELLSRLQAEFGCQTLDEARTLLTRMQKKQTTLTKLFAKRLQDLEDNYGNLLID